MEHLFKLRYLEHIFVAKFDALILNSFKCENATTADGSHSQNYEHQNQSHATVPRTYMRIPTVPIKQEVR